MTNVVVISFKNEKEAIDASHKLIELESFGDISIYEKILVKKELNGDTSLLQTNNSEGLRVASGMAIGTLVGAFAGPIGLLIGMLTGTLAGTLAEANYIDFSEDIISKVIDQLKPGTVAIVAEIYEEGPAFVDNVVASFNATVTRSNVDYVYDEFIDGEIKEIDDEIASERARIKSSVTEDKASIRQKIDRLKQKRKQRIIELKESQKSRKKSRLTNKINKQEEKTAQLQSKLDKLG